MIALKAFHVRQLLFAADFSPCSDHAFDAALALAQHFGARLHLLHVIHAPQEVDAAEGRLSAFAQERVSAVEFTLAIWIGDAATQIVTYAERRNVDLIVMGTHGWTRPLSHVVRGRAAEAVMRHAPCLVLTIGKGVELPLEAAEPSAHGPQVTAVEPAAPGPMTPALEARRAGWHLVCASSQCLVCALPSEDLICDTCKIRIQAEALCRLQQDERAGRP
jgi:nucleotide-binding universal stress UspA family protein